LVLAAALATGFAISHSRPPLHAASVSTLVPEAVGLQRLGIRYETPTAASKITREQAIQAASAWLGSYWASHASQVSAQYVLFSDDEYTAIDAPGRQYLRFQRVPAWVVTFEGLSLPSRGPPTQPAVYSHEEHIVIDAETGIYMEAFSYQ
jgi:hypothetical protein